jgi:hypothetical protein
MPRRRGCLGPRGRWVVLDSSRESAPSPDRDLPGRVSAKHGLPGPRIQGTNWPETAIRTRRAEHRDRWSSGPSDRIDPVWQGQSGINDRVGRKTVRSGSSDTGRRHSVSNWPHAWQVGGESGIVGTFSARRPRSRRTWHRFSGDSATAWPDADDYDLIPSRPRAGSHRPRPRTDEPQTDDHGRPSRTGATASLRDPRIHPSGSDPLLPSTSPALRGPGPSRSWSFDVLGSRRAIRCPT